MLRRFNSKIVLTALIPLLVALVLMLSAANVAAKGKGGQNGKQPTETATTPKGDPTPTPKPSPTPTKPPTGGGEGCTPGYWKQPHHLDSWVTYEPGASFDVTFGVTSSFGGTLLEALWRGGGHEKALGRHAVAALLNAASDVGYLYSTEDVVRMVQEAYDSGNFNSTKNQLAAQNELGCPLN